MINMLFHLFNSLKFLEVELMKLKDITIVIHIAAIFTRKDYFFTAVTTLCMSLFLSHCQYYVLSIFGVTVILINER